jgi:hypothetical protein
MTRVSDNDLGKLIRAGQVKSALILKGNFTPEERELARRAYELGIEHGKKLATGGG